VPSRLVQFDKVSKRLYNNFQLIQRWPPAPKTGRFTIFVSNPLQKKSLQQESHEKPLAWQVVLSSKQDL